MGRGELGGVARLHATEMVVELRDDAARADLIGVVVRGEGVDALTVVRSDDVDRDVVARRRRPLNGAQLAVLTAQAIDLIRDVLVDGVGARNRDRQPLVAGNLDLGAHLDDSVELDVARLLASGDVELGLSDGVDVVLADRFEIELGDRLLDRLGPSVRRFNPCLEDLAWDLARTEARNADLLGDGLPSGVDGWLELLRFDGDRDFDLVALNGLDGGLHRARSLPALLEAARTTPC